MGLAENCHFTQRRPQKIPAKNGVQKKKVCCPSSTNVRSLGKFRVAFRFPKNVFHLSSVLPGFINFEERQVMTPLKLPSLPMSSRIEDNLIWQIESRVKIKTKMSTNFISCYHIKAEVSCNDSSVSTLRFIDTTNSSSPNQRGPKKWAQKLRF